MTWRSNRFDIQFGFQKIVIKHDLKKKREHVRKEQENTSPQKPQQHQEHHLNFQEAPMYWLSQAIHTYIHKQTYKQANKQKYL